MPARLLTLPSCTSTLATICCNSLYTPLVRYNPPPNWPAPPSGWQPPPGWRPDPSWGPVPPGWPLWVDDYATATDQTPDNKPRSNLVGAIKHPVWVSVGTVAAVLSLVVAGVSYLQSQNRSGQLEVAAVTIENVTELQGANFDITGSNPDSPMNVGAMPIDVTLKNNGNASVSIAKIEAELVSQVGKVKDCTTVGAGPAAIKAEYAVRLPYDANTGEVRKQPVLAETDFKIDPGRVERLAVTVGPGEQTWYSALLLEVRLRLIQDDGTEIDLPKVVLITPQSHVEGYIEHSKDSDYLSRSCLDESIATLDQALSIDGVHSTSIAELREAYESALPRAQ